LDSGLSTAVNVDRERARQVRLGLLEDAAKEGRRVVPAHFRSARRMLVRPTATGLTPHFPSSGI
jgi:hypothetical protein